MIVDLLGVTHYVPLFRHTLQPYSVVGCIRNDVQPYHIQKWYPALYPQNILANLGSPTCASSWFPQKIYEDIPRISLLKDLGWIKYINTSFEWCVYPGVRLRKDVENRRNFQENSMYEWLIFHIEVLVSFFGCFPKSRYPQLQVIGPFKEKLPSGKLT